MQLTLKTIDQEVKKKKKKKKTLGSEVRSKFKYKQLFL